MHAPDVKAGCIAALLAGIPLADVSRQYRVPKPTLTRWRDDVLGTDGGEKTERNGTPDWLPSRGASVLEDLNALRSEMVYACRVLVAYQTQPSTLLNADPATYTAITGCLDSIALRVSGIAAGLQEHEVQPGLPAPTQAGISAQAD